MAAAKNKGTPQDWQKCPGREAFVSLRDEVMAVRDDYRSLADTVNKLAITVATDVTAINGYVRELHTYNKQQNGHIRETKEAIEKTDKRLTIIWRWSIRGGLTLLAMQILMVSGVVIDIPSMFKWLIKFIGL